MHICSSLIQFERFFGQNGRSTQGREKQLLQNKLGNDVVFVMNLGEEAKGARLREQR